MKGIVVILLVGMMFFGCVKPPSYSVVPSITFNSMSPTTVSSSVLQISNPPDTTRVMINFTDGDGDIGLTQNDTTYDAYFIDTRPAGGGKFKVITIDSFAIPYVNPSGNIKAISGTINFTINSITGRAG